MNLDSTMLFGRDDAVPERNAKIFEVFIVAAIALALVSTLRLTTHFMTVDGEYQNNLLQAIVLGRWFDAALKATIFPEPYAWFWSPLIGVLLIAASAAVLAQALQLSRRSAWLFAVIFCSFPQLAYQLEFINQADTIGVGFLLASVSFYCQRQSTRWAGSMVWPVLLTACAFGIYQSFVFFPAFLFVADQLRQSLKTRISVSELARAAIKPALITVLAFVVSTLIAKQVRTYFSLQETAYFSTCWAGYPPKHCLIAAVGSLARVHVGLYAYGIGAYCMTLVSFVVIAIRTRHVGASMFVKTLLAIAYLAIPCLLIPVIGGPAPTRTLMLLGIALALAVTFAADTLTLSLIKRTLIGAAFLAYGVFFSFKLYYSDVLSYRADHATAVRLASDIKHQFPSLPAGQPAFFYGDLAPSYGWQPNRSESFQHSFFSWDNGNNSRIVTFMRTDGVAHFSIAPQQTAETHRERIAAMPVWPHEGSIVMDDGVLIVKLSDAPGYLGHDFDIRTEEPHGIGMARYIQHLTGNR